MPIYEYKCKDCGTYTEKRQKVSDERLKVCENCGGTLEKQWSSPAIQFRGEGWYVTDYAGKKSGDGKSNEKSDSGESTGSTTEASKAKTDGGTDTSKKD